MRVITYDVKLLEPVIVTMLDGDPNSAVAYDFLPGSVLRAAAMKGYIRAKGIHANELVKRESTRAEAQRLFFDGTTRYLNGYPLDRTGRRSLPLPLSWQQKKEDVSTQTADAPAAIFDFAVASRDAENVQWQSMGKPFCSITGQVDNRDRAIVRLITPERQITVHTARDRNFGRSTSEEGAVYRYEALAAGQTFGSAIVCEDSDADDIMIYLAGEAALGGSRTAGYGSVEFHNPAVLEADAASNWREVGTAGIESGERVILTLTSDILLRDANGQYTTDVSAIVDAIKRRPGLGTLSLAGPFTRGRVVGGFNRKWGLPLPQALAVKMGSVLVYHCPGWSDEIGAALANLETHGIGERRAEGYGRLAVNWQAKAEVIPERSPAFQPAPLISLVGDTTSSEIALQMATRMLRKQLDQQVVAKANLLAGTLSNLPSRAQISRLRNVIHDELMHPQSDMARISNYMTDVQKRNTARKQWERARISDQGLTEWIDDVVKIDNEQKWEKVLQLHPRNIRIGREVKGDLTHNLRNEYSLRLIDAVLALAAKQSRKAGDR